MFKEILSAFKKVFSRKELWIALVVVVIIVALFSYSNAKTFSMDGMEAAANSDPQPHETPVSESHTESTPAGYEQRPVNTASDLFPVENQNEYSALNPGLSATSMPDLDRIPEISRPSLRNANYQLRSDVEIPMADVGIWNKSTILPDTTRAPLEIGPH
jgi:hypothetical protein